MNSCSAISALVCPAQIRSRTSCSRLVRPERVRAGRRPRPGRDRPDAEQAHLLPGDPGGGGRAEVIEDAQCLAQGRFVRWRHAGPSLRRTGSPGRSRAGRRAASHPAAATGKARRPHRAAAGPKRSGAATRRPRRAARRRSAPRPRRPARPRAGPASGLPSSQNASARASRTGPICCGSPDPVSGGHGLVEALPGTGLAAAGPDHAEPPQRAEPVDRRCAGLGQEFGAQRHRLGPAAGLLQDAARSPRSQVA